MHTHSTAMKAAPKCNRTRIITLLALVLFAGLGLPDAGWAQSSSCKQCSDQRRTCMANYSAQTCKTEYDRCMKDCQHK
jgi:hypothetical protein